MTKTLLLVVAVAAALGTQQSPYSPVSAGVRVDDYVGVVCAAAPVENALIMFAT